MKILSVFIRKELLESWRTYKIFILIMVFLALGFLGPISAYYLPDLMSSFLPEGIHIEISAPVVFDAWAQFFKNIPQIGCIVFVVIFSSSLTMELHKGTLINVVTKGLPRDTIILAKFINAIFIWTICFLLALLTSYLYSMIFWRDVMVAHLWFASMIAWLFGVLLMGMLLLGQTLSKSTYGSLLFCGIMILCFFIQTMIPVIHAYSPMMLVSGNMELLNQSAAISDFYPSIITTTILIFLSLFAAILIFRKKQL